MSFANLIFSRNDDRFNVMASGSLYALLLTHSFTIMKERERAGLSYSCSYMEESLTVPTIVTWPVKIV